MSDIGQAWREEITLALPVNPQLIVTGNINDRQLRPGGQGHESTIHAITGMLLSRAFDLILLYDPAIGLEVLAETEGSGAAAALGLHGPDPAMGPSDLGNLLRRLVPTAQTADADRARIPRAAVIVSGASRLRDPEYPHEDAVHELLVAADHLASGADPVARDEGPALYNVVIWLVDRPQDAPSWFTTADPVRIVSIPVPTLGVRVEAARRIAPGLPQYASLDAAGRAQVVTTFARSTDGSSIRGMIEIGTVARANAIPAIEVDRAALLHRVGIAHNPWRDEALQESIRTARSTFGAALLGQDRAIDKMWRLLARAYLGLSGGHLGDSHPGRPQGVALFSGPTGVGKTELAKLLAKLLFGSADHVVRIDMSEYRTEHSEARLIGAPPGYAGHNAGGQLTNAVRAQPFTVVLFDEIEKAHPSILPLFLQVLEDGRLTDGTGATVDFSQTLIIFTSNLGIYGRGDNGRRRLLVGPDDAPESVESTVRDSVHRHFTEELGMPEWLNRLGQNIVVFDFIRPAHVPGIVDKFVGNLRGALRARAQLDLELSPEARDELIAGALENLEFGGRGIGSIVEQRVVEPLGIALFEEPRAAGSTVRVSGIREEAGAWHLELA